MKIKFLGAAREVTGSKHLITTEHGKKILLDCGAFQGKGLETDSMNRNPGVDPAEIDHIILSHAHIDHSGMIPFFYKNGFRGSVICTSATRDLCAIMLADSGFIQEHDTLWFNKKRARKGLPPVQPIYTKQDAVNCMELFIGVAYNRKLQIDKFTKVKFTNAGHLLGSSIVSLEVDENGKKTHLAFTGDIGRPQNYILRPPDVFPPCDFLIAESTYGARLHKDRQGAEAELLRIVQRTCVEKKGKLIIPSFAIGRTQEIVYVLNNFYNAGLLPKIPIYVDSPLAVNATDIFRVHPECFNKEVIDVMQTDSDPFGFGGLHYIKNVEDSKQLNDKHEPCVIISASGMMEAGRIKHHLANNIENPLNSILIVGYCAPTTLGARITRGDTEISIFGMPHSVKAEVFKIDSFSGHGDYNEMSDYLGRQVKETIKQLFLVHGEYAVQQKYADILTAKGFKNIQIPKSGDEYDLVL